MPIERQSEQEEGSVSEEESEGERRMKARMEEL